ncbi:hypothetical protein [Prosthecobacter sp.]|uniref:hypothetical protein n=1 Tax=Prosthecobacter sp. TaxID=1965333 RepID=UPI002488BC10|nr:hypothetical protein [Prosthecobacter sp.]MDI1312238.1 hypothetical protein [Prosthecobacter sp.]
MIFGGMGRFPSGSSDSMVLASMSSETVGCGGSVLDAVAGLSAAGADESAAEASGWDECAVFMVGFLSSMASRRQTALRLCFCPASWYDRWPGKGINAALTENEVKALHLLTV